MLIVALITLKSDLKGNLIIFVAGLLLSAPFAVFANSYFLSRGSNGFSTSSTSFFLSPAFLSGAFIGTVVLVCVVFYFIGKKINLSNGLWKVLTSLALGTFIGYAIAYWVLAFSYQSRLPSPMLGTYIGVNGASIYQSSIAIVTSGLLNGFSRVFSSDFFIALAVLAITYLRTAKPVIGLQPNDPVPQLKENFSSFGSGKAVIKVSLVGFLLAIPFAAFSNSIFFINLFNNPSINPITGLTLAISLGNYGSFFICPIIFFVVFYFLGRSINLVSKLWYVIIPLVLSCFIGYVVTYGSLAFFYGYTSAIMSNGPYSPPLPSFNVFLTLILSNAYTVMIIGLVRVLSTIFFVALAAIATANLQKIKSVPIEPTFSKESLN